MAMSKKGFLGGTLAVEKEDVKLDAVYLSFCYAVFILMILRPAGRRADHDW